MSLIYFYGISLVACFRLLCLFRRYCVRYFVSPPLVWSSALTVHTPQDCDENEANSAGSVSLAKVRGPQGSLRAPRSARRRVAGLQRPAADDSGPRRERPDLRPDEQVHADAQVWPQRRAPLADLSGTPSWPTESLILQLSGSTPKL